MTIDEPLGHPQSEVPGKRVPGKRDMVVQLKSSHGPCSVTSQAGQGDMRAVSQKNMADSVPTSFFPRLKPMNLCRNLIFSRTIYMVDGVPTVSKGVSTVSNVVILKPCRYLAEIRLF